MHAPQHAAAPTELLRDRFDARRPQFDEPELGRDEKAVQ
jgi:hypothetical protein